MKRITGLCRKHCPVPPRVNSANGDRLAENFRTPFDGGLNHLIWDLSIQAMFSEVSKNTYDDAEV